MDLRTISLCTGGGGLELGVRLAGRVSGFSSRVVCYVEREAYAQAVLVSRIQEGNLDQAPIWSDLKTFDPSPWRGKVDLITGGYPCQPFSHAGKRLAEQDPRHLWPDIRKIIGSIKPSFCFFENVDGHLAKGYDAVKGDLEELGYTVTQDIFAAEEVLAPHRRNRLFILAYRKGARLANTDSGRREGVGGVGILTGLWPSRRDNADGHGAAPVGNPASIGQQRHRGSDQRPEVEAGRSSRTMANPDSPRRRALAPEGVVREGRVQGRRLEGTGGPGDPGPLLRAIPGGSEELDHAAGSRPEWWRPEQGQAFRNEARYGEPCGRRDGVASGQEELADATSDDGWTGERSEETGAGPDGIRRRGSAGGNPRLFPPGSEELAHSQSERRIKSQVDRNAGTEQQSGRSGPTARGNQLFPPGPEEFDRWLDILETRGDLAPALPHLGARGFAKVFEAEPEVRGMVDGLASELDDAHEMRAERLSLLGNGVVPACAALSLIVLLDQAGLISCQDIELNTTHEPVSIAG